MLSYGDLRPSEVVHLTIPDPAEQAPLVARSVTPPSPSGRGGTTLLRQRAPRSCTVFVMTPPNEHTSEGGRDDRGVPYHAESTLSSAQVLKSSKQTGTLGPALGEPDLTFWDIASDPCFSRCFVARSARHLTLRSPAMASTPRLSETRGTIQLRSTGSNALSLRRDKTARILHASLHRWLD